MFVFLFRLLFYFKVEGLSNIPQKANFIITANHSSFLDPLIIGCAVPKKIYWFTTRELYRISWLAWFLQKVEALPVGQSSTKGFGLLNKNKNIGLFPEGACSRDGSLKEFRRGAALLAIKTGRPIVPCAVLGAHKAYPRTARLPKFFLPLKVAIGEPIYLLKEFRESVDDVTLQQGMLKVRNSIKEMLNGT